MEENYPRTLMELEERFSTEAACLEYLRKLRWPNGFVCVNDRPNGATHVRGNGATLKWQSWGSRRASKLAFFTPFRNNIFYGFSAADQRQLLSPLNDN